MGRHYLHCKLFQSTHPLRGATKKAVVASNAVTFQSTHPLRGATSIQMQFRHPLIYFNPRTPCGARLLRLTPKSLRERFQSTHPLRGATMKLGHWLGLKQISIHAPLAGRDSKFDEFLSANLHKSNKRDLLSEEKMRHSLPQTAHVSHFRSFLGAKLQRFSARLPFALRS